MSVAAVEICKNLKLSFAKIFTQQFVFSPKGDLSLPGFQDHRFAGWHLYLGDTLPFAIARRKDKSRGLVVLGRAVDAEGHLVTSTRLDSVLPRLTDLNGLQSYVAGLGGRYVAFVHCGKTLRCYLDPSGTMGVVANRENQMVGSTLYLVMTDRILPVSDYPKDTGAVRLSFGYTADKDVRALTPNHYFDLSKQTETRHWPQEESFACRSLADLDQGIDRVVQRHGQIIRALSDAEGPVILPLSGGEDTRQLLAMTLACDCPIDFRFSHVTTWKTQSDAQIAQQLCDRVGLEMDVFRCDGSDAALRPRLVRRLLTERAVATGSVDVNPERINLKSMGRRFRQVGRELAAIRRLPVGGTVLRGHVTDIGKAVLWRHIAIRAHAERAGSGVSPEIGVKMLMHELDEAPESPWLWEKFEHWQNTLPPQAQRRSIDFMGLELYRTYTIGTLFYALNRNFYMSPGCDRTIIESLVSVPPRLRYDFHFNDRLLAVTVPAFRDIPYARGHDNRTRLKRPSLNDGAQLYELQEASDGSTPAATSPAPPSFEQIRTPLLRSVLPGGKTLWIKNEAAQPSGSFKIRGPGAFLERNEVPGGIVTTASSGNHAIGLSMVASQRDLIAEIMVPRSTPQAKLDAIRRAGGKTNLVDGDYEAALAYAETFAEKSGAVLVPSYDHADTIHGNQQIFEEIKEELETPVHNVFVPIGGGGILSGAIQAHQHESTEVFGVEMAPYQRTEQIVTGAIEAIPPFASPPAPSTEGVAIRTLGRIPADIIGSASNLALMSVTIEELQDACRWLWFSHGVRAELGGCTALAGALKYLRSGGLVDEAVCVVSGGNISEQLHRSIVRETALRAA